MGNNTGMQQNEVEDADEDADEYEMQG